MKRLLRATLFTSTTLTCAAVLQQSRPLPLVSYLDVGTARIAFESDTGIERGRRLALAHTSFERAAQLLGHATLASRGDAGDVLRWVCYRLDGSPRMSLVLEGDEMSGENIGGFEFVRAGARDSLEHQCTAIHVPTTDVRTNRGVRIGLTRQQVEHALHLKGRDSANVVVFEQDVPRTLRDAQGKRAVYDEVSSLTVRFRNNKVVEFSAWRVDAS